MEKFTLPQLAHRFGYPADTTREILMQAGVEPIDDDEKEVWLANAVEALRATDRSRVSFTAARGMSGAITAKTVAAPRGITCRLPPAEVTCD